MAGLDLSRVMAKIDAIGEGFGDKEAQIGFFPAAQYEDGTPVAYVAAIQELGSPKNGIPPRPFMKPTVEDKQKDWSNELGEYAKGVIAGRLTVDGMFDFIGAAAAGDIAKTIAEGDFKPLSKITLMLRKMRDEHKGDADWHMSGAKVGEAARRVAAGEAGSDRTAPLDDTGLLIASLSHIVADKS